MHIEIQVALNFVISYLYNKLPRRRVNLFGEELERALKEKFIGHWYPDKPVKGSAFRCLRVGTPIDPVLETAAHASGIDLHDIRDNLPDELSVWIDPGEVSYRIGEKGIVKMLYVEEEMTSSVSSSSSIDVDNDREVTRSFNPEAQCFKPIESVSTSLGNLIVSPTTSPFATSPSPSLKSSSPTNSTTTPFGKSLMPLTFTTATFAQTKFGSTKLKTNSKRSNRMSPTEFSNYIKQRAILQQQQQPPIVAPPMSILTSPSSPQPPQRPRSLSPNRPQEHQLLFMGGGRSNNQHQQHLRGLFENGYIGDLFGNGGNAATVAPSNGDMTPSPFLNDTSKSLLDGINFNMNTMPYPNQHLLVAN